MSIIPHLIFAKGGQYCERESIFRLWFTNQHMVFVYKSTKTYTPQVNRYGEQGVLPRSVGGYIRSAVLKMDFRSTHLFYAYFEPL